MSYDVQCYDLARKWLANRGWSYDADIATLAQLIQDVCEDYEADLDNELALSDGKNHGQ